MKTKETEEDKTFYKALDVKTKETQHKTFHEEGPVVKIKKTQHKARSEEIHVHIPYKPVYKSSCILTKTTVPMIDPFRSGTRPSGTKYNTSMSRDYIYPDCSDIGFRKHQWPLPDTALASAPGSGNTWLRHIIQQLTGRENGFHCPPLIMKTEWHNA